jgi:hypothetical protein
MNIKIKGIPLEDIQKNPKNYNVNNLSEVIPNDYNDTRFACNTQNWIESFHDFFIHITIENIQWMKEANNLYNITNKWSHLYDDELEELTSKLSKEYTFKWEDYFVRTSHVSLKESPYGIGPYRDFKSIIKAICCTYYKHAAIQESDKVLNIYLLKWINFNYFKEFRVFVYKNKITGISNQHLYEKNTLLTSLSKNDLEILAKKIVEYFYNDFTKKWKNTITHKLLDSYTFDLLIDNNDNFYFIEPNSFGASYAAGSSLFHWELDYNQLTNYNNEIEFRYTC